MAQQKDDVNLTSQGVAQTCRIKKRCVTESLSLSCQGGFPRRFNLASNKDPILPGKNTSPSTLHAMTESQHAGNAETFLHRGA